jgi:hypothetical protein
MSSVMVGAVAMVVTQESTVELSSSSFAAVGTRINPRYVVARGRVFEMAKESYFARRPRLRNGFLGSVRDSRCFRQT